MTGMLASVTSVTEALLVLGEGVDIIDLKQPASGALGALGIATINDIVAALDGRCPVSATLGDLPMQPDVVFNAVKTMAATGVDYIKIGFFPNGDWQATVEKLSALKLQNLALIAVLFADTRVDLGVMRFLKDAGFKGVMLDTLNKQQGPLTQLMTAVELEAFVSSAKASQLLCGLAGSLRLADIPLLMPYQADYLGFRGALCEQHNRVGQLNRAAVAAIKRAIVM
jgi:uncharacterized protein (UPF0264 family)